MSKRTGRHRRRRELLRHAQSGLCAGCAQPIGKGSRRRKRSPSFPTFDHYHPRHLGGSYDLSIGLLKHRICNELRGSRMPNGCDTVWHMGVHAKLEAILGRSIEPQTVFNLLPWSIRSKPAEDGGSGGDSQAPGPPSEDVQAHGAEPEPK